MHDILNLTGGGLDSQKDTNSIIHVLTRMEKRNPQRAEVREYLWIESLQVPMELKIVVIYRLQSIY